MKIFYQYWNTTHSWHMFLMDNEGYCISSPTSKTLSGLIEMIEECKKEYDIVEVKKLKASEYFSCEYKLRLK